MQARDDDAAIKTPLLTGTRPSLQQRHASAKQNIFCHLRESSEKWKNTFLKKYHDKMKHMTQSGVHEANNYEEPKNDDEEPKNNDAPKGRIKDNQTTPVDAQRHPKDQCNRRKVARKKRPKTV